ncbi:hypothetical protein RI844_12410 [Thalassotalea fonticola]|uniref:LVIVD repeat-containing protein n=1 Tax=Thalassotalea fonticola TaxID=3065649 RepID=A0ABZ0GKT0_9GAMM|nr:hypothetical protein RI844_12410 [Colwelliaceae bacterium S1-1]
MNTSLIVSTWLHLVNRMKSLLQKNLIAPASLFKGLSYRFISLVLLVSLCACSPIQTEKNETKELPDKQLPQLSENNAAVKPDGTDTGILPEFYYVDKVLGVLPKKSLTPLSEAAGRIDGEVEHPDPSTFGFNKTTGKYTHPKFAPEIKGPKPFKGSLTYIDMEQYSQNIKVEAFYPYVTSTGHTYQSVLDFDGRRYMYNSGYPNMHIYDITDPRKLIKVPTPKAVKSDVNGEDDISLWGFFRYVPRLDKYYTIKTYSPPYVGYLENKYLDPDRVKGIRNWPTLKGFRVFEMTDKDKFELVASVTSDPNATVEQRPQQGGGCSEFAWDGNSKYMFITCAPDDSYGNQPYRSMLYSYGISAYDMTDPSKPKYLSTWHVPGQLLSEQEAFKKNPRHSNKASRLGARAMFVPKYPDFGGKYGYVAMGGWGFHVVDISDPSNMKTVGKIDDFPMSVSGNEGDSVYVDVVAKTGHVYFNGYPFVEDCYEPYKDIFSIDVTEPTKPKVVSTFERPTPPQEATFTDYCQRRGSFGPKRPGASGRSIQPGTPNERYAPWSFYNAGLQLFDLKDPNNINVAGYFVPKMMDPEMNWHFGNPTNAVFVEWDRNLMYLFTNHGFYVLSSPLLGDPLFEIPPGQTNVGRIKQ